MRFIRERHSCVLVNPVWIAMAWSGIARHNWEWHRIAKRLRTPGALCIWYSGVMWTWNYEKNVFGVKFVLILLFHLLYKMFVRVRHSARAWHLQRVGEYDSYVKSHNLRTWCGPAEKEMMLYLATTAQETWANLRGTKVLLGLQQMFLKSTHYMQQFVGHFCVPVAHIGSVSKKSAVALSLKWWHRYCYQFLSFYDKTAMLWSPEASIPSLAIYEKVNKSICRGISCPLVVISYWYRIRFPLREWSWKQHICCISVCLCGRYRLLRPMSKDIGVNPVVNTRSLT